MTLGAPLIWLIPLEVIVDIGLLDRRFFLSPIQIASGLIDGLREGWLVVHLTVTAERLIVGYLVGIALAVPVVLARQRVAPIRVVFGPAAATAALACSVAIVPLIFLIFGLGEASKWAIAGMATFWTLLLGLELMSGQPSLADSPQRMPLLRYAHSGFSALKLALATSLMCLTVMEMVGSKTGLGYVLWQGWSFFKPDLLWVAMMTIFLVAYLIFVLLTALEWLVLRAARRPVDPASLPAGAEEPASAG